MIYDFKLLYLPYFAHVKHVPGFKLLVVRESNLHLNIIIILLHFETTPVMVRYV